MNGGIKMSKRRTINTHYTLETRSIIENRLNEGMLIKDIANELNRDNSNIAKEINKHKVRVFPTTFNKKLKTFCLNYDTCTVKSYECYKTCKNVKTEVCPKLLSSPHVCNGCSTKKYCKCVKQYYKANEANCEYLNSLTNSRTGMHYSESKLEILNNDFANLFYNTRSIHHTIIYFDSKEIVFNERTIYQQIKNNQLRIKSADLPKCRKRKSNTEQDNNYKRESIEGMTYEDYEKYKENHPDAIEIQMDTVLGTNYANEPAMLTLQIVNIKFLFILKINEHTATEVRNKLSWFKEKLGNEIFEKVFEILLTDNGSEFINSKLLIETLGNKVNIFYCHPYSSYEKGAIENNHELIRYVIPKGINLSIYNQKDYDLLSSHINSLIRKSLNDKCPFDLIEKYIPKSKLEEINIHKIEADKIILTPRLLGNKNIENIKKYLDINTIKKNKIFID